MKIHKEYTLDLAGKTYTARFSDLTNQANGSVVLECESTVILATAVMSKSGKGNPGWFNLTVEYAEKFYAAGEILGSRFNRREGRPTEEAVLSSRVIDRTIRPLFDKHIKNAVQVITTVIAVGNADPGVMAVNAASLALATSDIPWNGPIGCVHVSQTHENPEFAINNYIAPDYSDERGGYTTDLTVCGRQGTINMIEAGAHELDEDQMGQAFDLAMAEVTRLEDWQNQIVAEIGKAKIEIPKPEVPAVVSQVFEEKIRPTLLSSVFHEVVGDEPTKRSIHDLEHHFKDEIELAIENAGDDERHEAMSHAHSYFNDEVDILLHEEAIKNNRRADGRGLNEVRAIFAQAGGLSSVLHGSGIFYRGETHVLSVLALGSPEEKQTIDEMEAKGEKRYMHHYNFPPYSAGETGRFGGFNRRAIGHGALAEKALVPVLPSIEEFPYTMRVVSESLASNGSTSQASICGSSLALMDGGVPIKRPVAGLAMGLILDENDSTNYRILADIQGPEDHHGDMDFKVAGTREGITAIQLDIKVGGISPQILKEALTKAKEARLGILDVMEAEISQARPEISPKAPKILMMYVPEEKIGKVIGKGGETIQAIQENTGATISIEDDGKTYITGKNGAAEAAYEAVSSIIKEWKVGETAQGTVVKILDGIGAIVKITEYHDGMVHISEIASFRVEKVEDVLTVGQTVPVKIIKVDNEKGRIGLSIKAIDPEFIKKPQS